MIYARDKIIIITCTMDENGVIAETDGSEIDANIKDSNRLIIDNNGQEVVGQGTIMVDKDNAVKYGDKIRITERFGIAYPLINKKFKILKIENIGGFSQDLIRITI